MLMQVMDLLVALLLPLTLCILRVEQVILAHQLQVFCFLIQQPMMIALRRLVFVLRLTLTNTELGLEVQT